MTEVYLVRHAKSYANAREYAAFGNEHSPLNQKGLDQCQDLREAFVSQRSINPEEYEPVVMTSSYVRPILTAAITGFRNLSINKLINESNFEGEELSGLGAVMKHAKERWAPAETLDRAAQFIGQVRTGELPYKIYFTHGLFIASTLMKLEEQAIAEDRNFDHIFSDHRGFIPDLATIVPVEI